MRSDSNNSDLSNSDDNCNSSKSRKRKAREKSSYVWHYFDLDNSNKCICSLCGRALSYNSSTSSMSTHLANHHCIYKHNFQVNKKFKLEYCSDSDTDYSDEEKSNESTGSLTVREIKFNNSLLEFLVKTNQPLSLVENNYFRNFIRILNDKVNVPTRNILKTDLVPEKYNLVKQQIKNKIKYIAKVSLTIDCWVSNSQLAYMGVTCHYLTPELILEKNVLCLKYLEESKTGEYLNDQILSVLEEYSIKNKVIHLLLN